MLRPEVVSFHISPVGSPSDDVGKLLSFIYTPVEFGVRVIYGFHEALELVSKVIPPVELTIALLFISNGCKALI